MAKPIASLKVEGGPELGLEDEVRQAERDFAQGDFIEVTIAQLDQCLAAGEWPWATASSA
jgi:hypothetical protein